MKISIVIPAFNEEKLIAASLVSINEACAAFAKRGWEVELIVCNNNSTDQTPALAEAAGARVVFEPINQISRARNTGAAAATGDWVVFIDADSHPSQALFNDVAQEIERGDCLAGGATLEMDRSRGAWILFLALWNTVSRVCRYMAGSFIFCETAAFRRVGGFSTELYAREEIDLSQRLKKLAHEQGRSVVILHRHPLVSSSRKLDLYGAGPHLRFLWRAVRHPHRAWRDPKICHLWYEGKR